MRKKIQLKYQVISTINMLPLFEREKQVSKLLLLSNMQPMTTKCSQLIGFVFLCFLYEISFYTVPLSVSMRFRKGSTEMWISCISIGLKRGLKADRSLVITWRRAGRAPSVSEEISCVKTLRFCSCLLQELALIILINSADINDYNIKFASIEQPLHSLNKP